MGRTQNKSRRNTATRGQTNGTKSPKGSGKRETAQIFPGGNSKYIENLSANTDTLRHLLKKNVAWEWTNEHQAAFETLKKKITEIPCWAHYNPDYKNVITTDASTKGLEATMWQEQSDGKLKPNAIACRFISGAEKKYAINELKLLAVVWGLKHFRLYVYGNPIKIAHRPPSIETAFKKKSDHYNL